MSKLLFLLFLYGGYVIHFGFVYGQRRLDEGDACRLRSNKKGICRVYEECPVAKRELEQSNLFPLICRYKGRPRIRVVCCDELENEPTNNSDKISEGGGTTTSTTTPSTTTSTKPPSLTSNVSPASRIAARKCEEYSKWLPPHKSFHETILVPTAGQCEVDVASFIIGGTVAKKLEFPHMARLGFGEEDDALNHLSWECGGSLISDRFILTAAHCLANRNGVPVNSVRLGHGDPNTIQVRKVVERIPHPSYKPPERYNDIALLRLDKPLVFNDFLRPACLQLSKNVGSNFGVATGWGVTEKSKQSVALLKVQLPLMSHANCTETYPVHRFLQRGIDDETMVCAGSLDEAKDTCQGDSGGPLQVVLKTPDCMYSLVGITSFGIKCGIAPGVYTRVSAFVPWIEEKVWL